MFCGLGVHFEDEPQTITALSDWSGLCRSAACESLLLSSHCFHPHHVAISPGVFVYQIFPDVDGEAILLFSEHSMLPQVFFWSIHSARLIWAQQGRTVGSQCWALPDTWKGKMVTDKENKT